VFQAAVLPVSNGRQLCADRFFFKIGRNTGDNTSYSHSEQMRGSVTGEDEFFPDLLYGGGFPGEHFADAFDLRAHTAKFLFNIFVAAVDVIDAVDDGFPVGHQSGEN
jgi:hypothetical protein